MPTTRIAENHITITRALFNEGMHAIGKKGYLKGMRNLTILLVLAYVLIAVWTFYNNGSPFMLIGETFTLTVLLLWMFIFFPEASGKLNTKSFRKTVLSLQAESSASMRILSPLSMVPGK